MVRGLGGCPRTAFFSYASITRGPWTLGPWPQSSLRDSIFVLQGSSQEEHKPVLERSPDTERRQECVILLTWEPVDLGPSPGDLGRVINLDGGYFVPCEMGITLPSSWGACRTMCGGVLGKVLTPTPDIRAR